MRSGLLSFIIVCGVLFAAASSYLTYSLIGVAVDSSDKQNVLVELAPGASFRDISRRLETLGLVKWWRSLDIIARLKKKDTQIKAGEYELSRSMTPAQIVAKLVSGEVYKRVVTLTPGMSVFELPAIVEQAGLIPGADIVTAARDKDFLTSLGINATSIEGYLNPETYYFSRPTSAREILKTMVESAVASWPPEYSSRAGVMGFTRHEMLTIASIIEKESGLNAERRLISSVFHNRLRQDMKLQSDPTAIYGREDHRGMITRKDLEVDSPYNTYLYAGLPPGPICNPSLQAIKAAFYPEDTQYLFFVADGSGGHVFASTLREHNRNVDAYRKLQRQQEQATRAGDFVANLEESSEEDILSEVLSEEEIIE